ncbi:hypothetical protein WMY93_021952 [Mugilogobius chulae]|uniref:HAT C-terminal dimerisation domain-containing protein n=1 Tax=Mugilogobius chulae TaxID=88201 RepID=A0AAW0NMN1_9GOBI
MSAATANNANTSSEEDVSNLAGHSKALRQTNLGENTPCTNVLAKWIAMDCSLKLNSFALTVMKTDTRHFAAECAEQFRKVANDWGIENKIFTNSTDSAANMLAAMRALPYEHIACNAHILQRTITVCLVRSGFVGVLAKCRKIVGHFKQSQASTKELNQQQVAPGKKSEQLMQDVPTRRNSTLAMVSRLLHNREAVKATLDQQNNHKLCCLHFAIWTVSMDITDDDPAYVVKFKNAFQKDLLYDELMPTRPEKRQQVWTSLENMLQAAETRRAATHQSFTEDDEPVDEPKKRRSDLLLGFDDSDSEEDGKKSGELQRYKAEPCISIDDCPLQWWYSHSVAYEKLSSLGLKYLASPATSVPCERLFNLAGYIVQKKRVVLLPENVTKLICLSDWLKKKKLGLRST